MRGAVRRALALGAALLLLGLGAGPADAAGTSTTITNKGHVRASDGAPLEGIRVSGGSDHTNYRKTYTDETGRYVLRIRQIDSQIALTFGDESHVHTNEFKSPFAARGGHTYRIDRVLTVASVIAGTVRDSSGKPIANSFIHLWSSIDREPVAEYSGATTDSKGHFHLRTRPGSYRVYFSYPNNHSKGTFFGGATWAKSTIVTVAEGAKTAGIDGVVPRD